MPPGGCREVGLDTAEECVRRACTALMRGNVTDLQQAGAHLARAVEIFSGWTPSIKPSLHRLRLHESIQTAGRLLEAVGRWCDLRRRALLPEQTPSCYGPDGRKVTAPAGATTTFHG